MNSTKPGGNRGDRPVSVANRKYLGSKRELADTIADRIIETSGPPEVFFDAFLGTGSVSAEFLRRGARRIIACDNLLSNTTVFEGAFALGEEDEAAFSRAIAELNRLPGKAGYVTRCFADTYFTRANCLRMDAVREEIEKKKTRGEVSGPTARSLLAAFLLAADRVANSLGQYDAFLKHLGRPGFERGRHVVDVRVYEEFALRPLEFLPAVDREIVTADVFGVAARADADTAYLDPPYNGRQYCDNYHVLENLARWEKPPVKGKTKKFDRTSLKSPFSGRRTAGPALAKLVGLLRAERVYLSYNSEGILAKDQIVSILAEHGAVKVWEIPYPVFGKGAGVSRKRTVTEYLFYVRKRKAPAAFT
jgi:adenine-specific DNA-methyltransferase